MLVLAAVAALGLLAFGVGTASASITCTDTIADQATVNSALAGGGTVTVNGTCLGSFVAPVSVTLQGGSPGATLTAAGLNNRTLKIENASSATVTVKNLKITGGSNKSNGAGVFVDAGNPLTVNLQSDTITGNSSTNQGGGLKAVCCAGTTINMTNTSVSGNTSQGNGGGLYLEDAVTLNATGSTISNNHAGFSGAGIDSSGATVTLTNSTVSGNADDPNSSTGGGILAVDGGTLGLYGSTVSGNTAAYEGGGILLGNNDANIVSSTISNNATTFSGFIYGGGAIYMAESDTSISNSHITSNSSGDYGGAIAFYGCGSLSLSSTTVDHNTASFDGGGIYNDAACNDAPVTIDQSTFAFNVAQTGDGGGIANYGTCGYTASILITNSSFGGNLATKGEGGGIYNSNGGGCNTASATVTVANSNIGRVGYSINPNKAKYGAGIYNEPGDGFSSLSLQSKTLVAGNQASVNGGGVFNCGGASLTTAGSTLISNTPNNLVNAASCPP